MRSSDNPHKVGTPEWKQWEKEQKMNQWSGSVSSDIVVKPAFSDSEEAATYIRDCTLVLTEHLRERNALRSRLDEVCTVIDKTRSEIEQAYNKIHNEAISNG